MIVQIDSGSCFLDVAIVGGDIALYVHYVLEHGS